MKWKWFAIDIDECGTGNGGCEQMCTNTNGGYLCECRAGFKRKANSLYGCEGNVQTTHYKFTVTQFLTIPHNAT